jgi:opacity protein-like surface antigen
MLKGALVCIALLLCPALAAANGLFIEGGYGTSTKPPDGRWYQEAYPHTLKMSCPNFGVGYSWNKWSIGYAQIACATTDAIALTNDVDYDPGRNECVANCEQTGRFITKGRVDGIFARYGFGLAKNLSGEVGLVLYRPEFQVRVENFYSRDQNGIPYGPVNTTYTNKTEYKVGVSLGVAYEITDRVSLVAQYYPSLKSSGDRKVQRADGRLDYESLSSSYTNALTVGVRFRF